MMKSHYSLVRYALARGARVAVRCAEEGDVLLKASTSFNAIKDAMESVGSAQLVILSGPKGQDAKREGAALVINDHSFDPDEFVVDWTCTPFMDAWEKSYHV